MTDVNNFVPLMMGDKIIGMINLDLKDGSFVGHIDEQATAILRDGIDGAVKSVTLKNIFGLAAHKDMTAQEKWSAYLREEVPAVRWIVINDTTNTYVVGNLETESEAKRLAKEFAESNPGYSFRYERQRGALDGSVKI